MKTVKVGRNARIALGSGVSKRFATMLVFSFACLGMLDAHASITYHDRNHGSPGTSTITASVGSHGASLRNFNRPRVTSYTVDWYVRPFYGTDSDYVRITRHELGTTGGSSSLFFDWDGNRFTFTGGLDDHVLNTFKVVVRARVTGGDGEFHHWVFTGYTPPKTITLNPQGGSGGSPSVSVQLGSPMPYAVAPSRTGYTFHGFWNQIAGGIMYYNLDMNSSRHWDLPDANILYARWQARNYTVYMNTLEGVGGSASVSATFAAPMPTATAPTRTGYTFEGYFDGSNVKYYNANMTSARNWDKAYGSTLYARWAGNNYSVTLNAQGGSGGSSSVSATFGSSMPAATAPTRAGYTFQGYFDGVHVQYYNADMTSARNWDKTSNTTLLYARWTANTYSVTLNRHGGSGGSASVSVTFGSSMPAATAPTRSGYTFQGYFDQGSGSGVRYYHANMASARLWDKAVNTTLFAHWTGNAYTVTLAPQGGSGGSSSVSATFGSSMPAATAPTRVGYIFEGYFDTQTGFDGVRYYHASMVAARTWDKAQNTTIYAHWTARDYTVTLNAQGGTVGGSSSVTVSFDSAMPSEVAPVREGYAFRGYFDQPGGVGTQYYDENMASLRAWDKPESTILYAQWTSTAEPALSVLPAQIDFGWILAGTAIQCTIQVRNIGGGTLSGNAIVSPPFSIVANGSYHLGEDGAQDVTVRYAPVAAGSHSLTLGLSGGGGASVPVAGGSIAAVDHGRIIKIDKAGEDVVLRWYSISGKRYAVESASDLNGGFSQRAGGIDAVPPTTSFPDTIGGAAHRFWRVRVED